MSGSGVKEVQTDISLVSDLLQTQSDFYHNFAMNSDRPDLLYTDFSVIVKV